MSFNSIIYIGFLKFGLLELEDDWLLDGALDLLDDCFELALDDDLFDDELDDWLFDWLDAVLELLLFELLLLFVDSLLTVILYGEIVKLCSLKLLSPKVVSVKDILWVPI